MQDIVIRGAGGHAEEVAYLINRINEVEPTWNLLGYIYGPDTGMVKYGYTVLGGDEWFETHKGINCVIGIGDSNVRKKVYEELEAYELKYPNIIDPEARISDDSVLGKGIVLKGPIRLSVSVGLEDFTLLNGIISIGHHAKLGKFVSVMPFVAISGHVSIGDNSYISVGSKVIEKISIGKNVTIGAGSIVIKNIKDNITVFGNPAKKIFDKSEE